MDNRIHAFHPTVLPKSNSSRAKTNHTDFSQLLKQAEGVQLSKHAKQRMEQRQIEVSDEQWSQIQTKLDEARQKGVKDSLVLTDQAAFIVNTKSNTVVTAMNRSEVQDKIFTNINGTILI